MSVAVSDSRKTRLSKATTVFNISVSVDVHANNKKKLKVENIWLLRNFSTDVFFMKTGLYILVA